MEILLCEENHFPQEGCFGEAHNLRNVFDVGAGDFDTLQNADGNIGWSWSANGIKDDIAQAAILRWRTMA